MGITSISQEVFLKVDKAISKFLSPHILSAERTEMAQCLYFIADKAELSTVEVNLRFFNVIFLIITITFCYLISELK